MPKFFPRDLKPTTQSYSRLPREEKTLLDPPSYWDEKLSREFDLRLVLAERIAEIQKRGGLR